MNNTDQKADPNPSISLREQFEDRIERVFPHETWTGIKVLVAVSGGADSVALLRGICGLASRLPDQCQNNLVVAHIDHGLRGEQSAKDATFVEQLASELKLDFLVAHADDESTISRMAKPSSDSEESLRNFRYEHLIKLAHQVGARYIATGHNFNDQVETILFRVFRGTGVAGLSGIPMTRLASDAVTLVRPLLEIKRHEIEAYLEELGQDFRTDESNAKSQYKRNYLRNELIPELEANFGSNLAESVSRLGIQAKAAHDFLVEQSKPLFDSVLTMSDWSVELDCQRLRDEPKILVRQFLVELWIKQNWPRQAMNFQWWEKMSDVLIGDNKNVVLNLPGDIRMERVDGQILFSRGAKK